MRWHGFPSSNAANARAGGRTYASWLLFSVFATGGPINSREPSADWNGFRSISLDSGLTCAVVLTEDQSPLHRRVSLTIEHICHQPLIKFSWLWGRFKHLHVGKKPTGALKMGFEDSHPWPCDFLCRVAPLDLMDVDVSIWLSPWHFWSRWMASRHLQTGNWRATSEFSFVNTSSLATSSVNSISQICLHSTPLFAFISTVPIGLYLLQMTPSFPSAFWENAAFTRCYGVPLYLGCLPWGLAHSKHSINNDWI